MAVTAGAYGTANGVTTTTAATFIPEMWSDEIVAAYKKSLVMANLVRKMSQKGKKGDTINIPMPSRASAQAKTANTVVRIQQDTESNVQILLNKHFEVSRLIEDIVTVQALSSLRKFYTDDAGYALGRQVDTDLILLGREANNGAGTAAYATAYCAQDGATLYTSGAPNQTALTDIGIRRIIQRLDDNDIPMDRRHFVVPPSTRNTLMGIARFTEQGFVGDVGAGNTIRNGKIGDLYGIDVFVTPQCDTATGAARIGLMFHEDSLVLAEQMSVRTQTQYKQEYLADLMTADCLYGTQIIRKGNDADVPTGVFSVALPA
jgi:N4-gp56 family major capsid protein